MYVTVEYAGWFLPLAHDVRKYVLSNSDQQMTENATLFLMLSRI